MDVRTDYGHFTKWCGLVKRVKNRADSRKGFIKPNSHPFIDESEFVVTGFRSYDPNRSHQSRAFSIHHYDDRLLP